MTVGTGGAINGGGTITFGTGGNVTLSAELHQHHHAGSNGMVDIAQWGQRHPQQGGGTITLGAGGTVTLGGGGNVTLGAGGTITLPAGGGTVTIPSLRRLLHRACRRKCHSWCRRQQ